MLYRTLVLATLGWLAPTVALANCPNTSVKSLDGQCLDARCPPGATAYMATIENTFPAEKLYITYAFRRPDNSVITAGLALKPGIQRLPLGFGRSVLSDAESVTERTGRLRILECGINPDIVYRWRKK
jgi:hypothetical protein